MDLSQDDKVPPDADDKCLDPRLEQAQRLFQTGVMLIYGKRKSVEKAIKCIQRAITFVDNDYKYWQFLGEAYYQRGSLNPAINCFMRSLKLVETDPAKYDETEEKRRRADCIYSRLRMSDIRHSVGHLEEAANGYGDIISVDPENVGALIGLSKTELQLARNSFSAGLVKVGHLRCMRALKFSLKSIKLRPHLCLTWKLASDCCLIQFVYGQRNEFEATIEEQFPGTHEDGFTLNRRTCIELAQQFLCKALAIEPFQESGCLWHNLGISLYLKSALIKSNTEREALLKRSMKCLLRAIDFDRDNSQVKNSIGVVAFSLNLLNSAQNFLIKSIQTNMSTSEVQFSNLGYIFLQKGEYRLASVAFSRCQAEEPIYSRSWLGNALVNEQNNIDNLSYLRHCYQLENNYVSQLMYATKVTSLPCSEEYHKDLTNCLECMKRIINYDEYSLEANNTLGLLYERANHHEQAILHFQRAYEISPQDSRVIFNKLRKHSALSSCFSLDDHFSSTQDADFIKIAEKFANGGNREYLLNYIYYLFNNGDYRSVNSRMTRFMDKLPPHDIKSKLSSQILLGLAAKKEGSDFKSWLFKNIIDSENIICLEVLINLQCLMLLGATTKDSQLVEQISKDFSIHLLNYISSKSIEFSELFYSNEGCWMRLAIFSSIFCLQDQSKLIRPLLVLFPTVAELWLYMGLALMFQKTKLQSALFCIKKASLIESKCADLGVICNILLAILSQMVKGKSYALDPRVKYLSRALIKYPSYELLWVGLISASGAKAEKIRKNQTLSEENTSLFQLVIEHNLRMILA